MIKNTIVFSFLHSLIRTMAIAVVLISITIQIVSHDLDRIEMVVDRMSKVTKKGPTIKKTIYQWGMSPLA